MFGFSVLIVSLSCPFLSIDRFELAVNFDIAGFFHCVLVDASCSAVVCDVDRCPVVKFMGTLWSKLSVVSMLEIVWEKVIQHLGFGESDVESVCGCYEEVDRVCSFWPINRVSSCAQ